jgi:GDP/UDP-N,N'-diacetylbacillosamine 2-epimerase (hydrolysing)
MNRKVCVVTGTRAEFGLLRLLMQRLDEAQDVELQVLATGMHLSPEFGLTYREIEQAGFAIDVKVEMLLSADSATAVTKSMGLGLIGFADAYTRLQPDVIILLGDRFEIFTAATAALIAGIPIAHLHGGETTEAAFDEALRHSITKMSHLHFVAAEEYRHRVIQLGEHPERVFLVGGLGIDVIKQMPLLGREAIEASLDFKLGRRNFLVTFHPVTLEAKSSSQQMSELLAALDLVDDAHIVFTLPNADTGGRQLIEQVQQFVSTHPNSRAYSSLGHLRYLSYMQFVDAVVGNSSSGLAEAPSLGVPTVNIGDRQKGRLRATSVIDCAPDRNAIAAALAKTEDPVFRNQLSNVINPYGSGGASERIADIVRTYQLDGILKKSFYNIGM